MPDPVLLTRPTEAYRIRAAARYRIVDGEAVVLLQDTGETLVLDEIGAAVLTGFESTSGAPVETVLDSLLDGLLESFDGDPETIRADVASFLRELEAAAVLERVPS